MNENINKEVEAVNIVPQSSINLSRHVKKTKDLEEEYFTWDIKCYCDDLDKAFQEITLRNEQMKKRFVKQ